MNKKLVALREEMKKCDIDAYLIPSGDDHHSEYVHAHFKAREYVSGFTGSAGTLLVTAEKAWLWTDGRYFLQAQEQLKGSGISLMKMNEPGVPSVAKHLRTLGKDKPYVLGFDGRVVSTAEKKAYAHILKPLGVRIETSKDLVDRIWSDRPAIEPSSVYALPLSVTGKSVEEKLEAVFAKMKGRKASQLLISDLTELAWLFNLRGSDVACTPVFFGFALLTEFHKQVRLFVMEPEKLPQEVRGLAVAEAYEDVYQLKFQRGGTLWYDPESTNALLGDAVESAVDAGELAVLEEATPVAFAKAVKNDAEIESTTAAHRTDGVCMVKFLYWLKTQMAAGTRITEMSAAAYLDNLRLAAGATDLSFETIAGYGAHGAVIHYQATPETDALLRPEGFLLVDSGGQYPNGTTDITRTIALGPLTKKMKTHYTYVLKSHIALATATFGRGTTGKDLDVIARKPLTEQRLDFNHGTGHGIGHLLSVHEGPNIISRRGSDCAFVPGMITSDEPGVYLENEFGIRLENEILCVDGEELSFEVLTICPFEPEAICEELLTEDEKKWLKSYHSWVYRSLKSSLTEAEANWLAKVTGGKTIEE